MNNIDRSILMIAFVVVGLLFTWTVAGNVLGFSRDADALPADYWSTINQKYRELKRDRGSEAAIEFAELLPGKYGSHYRFDYMRGESYMSLRKFDLAVQAFTDAMDHDTLSETQRATLLNNRGISLTLVANTQEGQERISTLERAVYDLEKAHAVVGDQVDLGKVRAMLQKAKEQS